MIGNYDRAKFCTTTECIFFNFKYRFWNADGSQAFMSFESILSNSCYRVWDNGILTPCDEFICDGFNNCVAIISTVIDFVVVVNMNR